MTATERTITRTTHSESETEQLAAQLARALKPGDCIALHGQLGAGKTRFVRGLAQGLNVNPAQVSSPTYVLMQEYTQTESRGGGGSGGGGGAIIHIDAYRLPEGDDLSSLGLDAHELDDAILVVEWAQRIADALPHDRFEITITHANNNERTIVIEPPKGRTIDLNSTEHHRCRACNTTIKQDSKHFPFCSNRCRMSDLNKWFSGDYKISREIKDADLDALD